MELLHYEDFPDGAELALGPYFVSPGEVRSFLLDFDPQPFHLDEETANNSVLGGMASSGWHSCAMLMRMICDAYLNRSAGMGSPGIDEVRWVRPVYVGETLSGHMRVLSRRVSSKRPDLGILTCQWDLSNAAGERKLEVRGINFMKVHTP